MDIVLEHGFFNEKVDGFLLPTCFKPSKFLAIWDRHATFNISILNLDAKSKCFFMWRVSGLVRPIPVVRFTKRDDFSFTDFVLHLEKRFFRTVSSRALPVRLPTARCECDDLCLRESRYMIYLQRDSCQGCNGTSFHAAWSLSSDVGSCRSLRCQSLPQSARRFVRAPVYVPRQVR